MTPISEADWAVMKERFDRQQKDFENHAKHEQELMVSIKSRLDKVEKTIREAERLKLHIWAAFLGGVVTLLLTQPETGKRVLDAIKAALL